MLAHMRRSSIVLIMALLPLLISGCGGAGGADGGGGRGTTDNPVTLAVAYTGTSTVSSSTGHVAISVNQTNDQVTGFLGFELLGVVNIGSYSGTLTGSSLTATFASSVPGQCGSTITATVSGTTITGTYTTTGGCATPETGTFTLQSSAAPPNIGGPASGTITDSILGAGTISFSTLSQNGVTITGPYTDSFGGAGQLYGVISGTTVYFDLIPTDVTVCPLAANGTLAANVLSANYAAYSCGSVETGTLTLTL